ncbi:MAG: hypothetical protein MUC92_14090, partial [Fimbriimonadaceae bacterium]|nr:hypothetical protein [Fimbriimonadaceae bacterium]
DLFDDKEDQKLFEDFFNEAMTEWEKDAKKGGYDNDVAAGMAGGLMLIYSAKTGKEVDEGILPTLVKQCQSILDGDAMKKATDQEKQGIYETFLCMGFFCAIMDLAAESGDDKKAAQGLATEYWKTIWGDGAEKITLSDAGLEIAE